MRLITGRELKALLNSLIEQIAAPLSLKLNEVMVKRRTGNYSQLPQLICIAASFQRGGEHIPENTDMPGGVSRNIAGAFGQISFSRSGDSERLMSYKALEELAAAPGATKASRKVGNSEDSINGAFPSLQTTFHELRRQKNK